VETPFGFLISRMKTDSNHCVLRSRFQSVYFRIRSSPKWLDYHRDEGSEVHHLGWSHH